MWSHNTHGKFRKLTCLLHINLVVGVIDSRVVDHGSLYESAPTNDYKSDICCFSEAHTTPRSKNKDFESGLCSLVMYSKQLCTTNVNCWSVVCKNIFDIYVTEYGTTLTTILPILFLYLNTVTVTAGTFEP